MNIKITLESLQILDAIDRKGSFAAAAQAMHKVPSAVTYTIRQLEETLAITLFDRTGHRAVLTDAGRELLQEGRHLLQAATELQSRVKRVATGVETELSIAVSDLFRMEPIYKLIEAFYAEAFGTRLRILNEVYGGCWDAVVAGRAEISCGATGDGPAGGGYSIHQIGMLEFVFAVSPRHPLAGFEEPLHSNDIIPYRSISAADSSRNLPARTSGILSGQDVLTVPNMAAKCLAQIQGLGVGYLPKPLAEKHVLSGDLVIKAVTEHKPATPCFLVWKTGGGKAQQWLVKRLQMLDYATLTD